jgi:DNA/RNA-binding domain of Phe-tRNA-synthetase-like protein
MIAGLMYFRHADAIWREFPELVPGVLFVEGIDCAVDRPDVTRFAAIAQARLAASSEAVLPEIQAWRRAFSRMGLEPTRYRSASESLLRRFRKEGSLPEIHPLVDLCNAVSLAFAIPIAAFDVAHISEHLEVRYATGTETYVAFSGEVEMPAEQEVVFADALGRVHARRWVNRQSGLSAVRPATRSVLLVAEALHESARADVETLLTTLTAELSAGWSVRPSSAILSRATPRFDFDADGMAS